MNHYNSLFNVEKTNDLFTVFKKIRVSFFNSNVSSAYSSNKKEAFVFNAIMNDFSSFSPLWLDDNTFNFKSKEISDNNFLQHVLNYHRLSIELQKMPSLDTERSYVNLKNRADIQINYVYLVGQQFDFGLNIAEEKPLLNIVKSFLKNTEHNFKTSSTAENEFFYDDFINTVKGIQNKEEVVESFYFILKQYCNDLIIHGELPFSKEIDLNDEFFFFIKKSNTLRKKSKKNKYLEFFLNVAPYFSSSFKGTVQIEDYTLIKKDIHDKKVRKIETYKQRLLENDEKLRSIKKQKDQERELFFYKVNNFNNPKNFIF